MQDLQSIITRMPMFTIFTETPSEKKILEQDFATFNDRFHIKLQEAPAINGILRSISYEIFQTTPPPLAQYITRMATDSLHLKLSLALYREVLAKIKKTEQLLSLYRQYFLSLASLVDPPITFHSSPSLAQFDEETSAIYHLQQLDCSPSEDLLITDFQAQLQAAVGKPSPSSTIKKTRRTAVEDLHVEDSPVMERLDLNNKVRSCWEEGGQWWKVGEAGQLDNPSRELSRFQLHKKEKSVFQESITGLVMEEVKFEQQREEELGRKSKRSEESLYVLFNKRMRQKIVRAKLRRRKR